VLSLLFACSMILTAPVASQSLGEKAASLAKDAVGAPYLWGGKGWDFSNNRFSESSGILNGYNYYNPTSKAIGLGSGLDCSGLIYWSFNKAARMQKNPSKASDVCPVCDEGAAGQWSNIKKLEHLGGSTDIPTEKNLKPGDLLFLQNTETSTSGVDHVGLYVGNGDVVHAKGPEGTGRIESKKLIDWLNLPTLDGKKYRDHFAGYGRVIASGVPNANPQKGDHIDINCVDKVRYSGTITDIGDGFLCLKAESSFYDQEAKEQKTEFYDVCIGIGAISTMTWAN